MQRRTHLYLGAIAALSLAGTAIAAEQKSVELFGVTVSGTTREQFRQALKQNGVRTTREENQYWVDTYDAKGVLDGASELAVGYTSTGKFAYAQYTFEGFMDADLVGKIIGMVSSKYGKPTEQTGNYSLGPVTARWGMGQAMQIYVWRNWPNTTTYLKFQNVFMNAVMLTEIEQAKKEEDSQKNKAQSKAF